VTTREIMMDSSMVISMEVHLVKKMEMPKATSLATPMETTKETRKVTS